LPWWLCALLCVHAALATTHNGSSNVLVLGSGGFLGRRLVRHLRAAGHAVHEVRGRDHVDLRQRGSLAALNAAQGPFSFIFFLACEVGGAKFLEQAASQTAILRHNVQMYETVFPWAAEQQVPVLFTSSYMRWVALAVLAGIVSGVAMVGPALLFRARDCITPGESLPPSECLECRFVDSGAYATVKRMGEEYVRALLPPALGRFVRLWNIYGSEPVSLRSHVLSDWSWQCVHHGFINSTTDAAERRQFLHVDDAAASLVAIYEHWHDAFAPAVAPLAEEVWRVDAAATSAQLAASAGSGAPDECSIDISSGEWSGLLDVADTIADVAAEDLGLARCPLLRQPRPSPPRPEIDPSFVAAFHAHWKQWVPTARYPLAASLDTAARNVPAAMSTERLSRDSATCVADNATGCTETREQSAVAVAPPGGLPPRRLGWIPLRAGIADMLRFHQEGMRRAVVDPALAPAALPGAVPVALAEVSAD
jgi:nucleoside-diphosphate-sugar epimerase